MRGPCFVDIALPNARAAPCAGRWATTRNTADTRSPLDGQEGARFTYVWRKLEEKGTAELVVREGLVSVEPHELVVNALEFEGANLGRRPWRCG